MGNKSSKTPETTSMAIESWYATEAARNAESRRDEGKSDSLPKRADIQDEEEEKQTPDVGGSGPKDPALASAEAQQMSSLRVVRSISLPSNAAEAAAVQITAAIHAASTKAHDALNIAVSALKKMDVTVVAKAALEWMKAHPWQTAAIVGPLILLACTPAFLGIFGFTASGIAAGSIAAGIQAGIGSVAAGSVFATLTSAAMFGYGLPIVLGGVWGISSAVLWGVAVWKKWRNGTGSRQE